MSDAWFASKVAPESDKDDGCHPQEAEVLKAYLHGTLPPADEAARAITLYIESERNPVCEVSRLWALLIDALTELPTSQQKVIDLLSAIKRLPPPSDTSAIRVRRQETQGLWRSLLGFGHLWADLHPSQRWRDLIKTCSPAEREELRRDQQSRAAVEAHLVVAELDIPLTWGYECICDALERSDAFLDVEVAAAGEWLMICGRLIRKDVAVEKVDHALGSGRDLWESEERRTQGKTMTEERWDFWKQRLEVVAMREGLEMGTGEAAERAIKAMKQAEA